MRSSSKIDNHTFPLVLPERNADDLYRWPLFPELGVALRDGRKGGISMDATGTLLPLSMAGSSKAIQRVLNACKSGQVGTIEDGVATGDDAALTALSDNKDCILATTSGTVVSVTLSSDNSEIAGFLFEDQYGESYINTNLPVSMSPSQRRSTQQRLMTLLRPSEVMLRLPT